MEQRVVSHSLKNGPLLAGASMVVACLSACSSIRVVEPQSAFQVTREYGMMCEVRNDVRAIEKIVKIVKKLGFLVVESVGESDDMKMMQIVVYGHDETTQVEEILAKGLLATDLRGHAFDRAFCWKCLCRYPRRDCGSVWNQL